MAIAKWAEGSGDCHGCSHAYPGFCAEHNPNLNEREKRVLTEFISRAKEAGLDGRTLSRLYVSITRPYKE
jgi:chorismate mutase